MLGAFSIGHFIGGQSCGIIAVAILGTLILSAYIITDKIILALSNSHIILQKNPFIERVKNISFYMEINPINIFITKGLPQNIYILDSLFGRPSIIITKDLIETLNNEQLDFLIKTSLVNIRSGEALQNMALSSLFAFIQIPLTTLAKYPLCGLFTIILNFFIAPLKVFKEYIIKNIYNKLRYKEEFNKMNEILSCINLLSKNNTHIPILTKSLIEDIGIIPPSKNTLWDYLILFYYENKSQALYKQKAFLN